MSEVDCRIPVDMDRTQMEIYNHFEAYGTTMQERSDLLKVLTHPQASLDGIRYCSGQGLRNHIEKDDFSDRALEANMWKGKILILIVNNFDTICVFFIQT